MSRAIRPLGWTWCIQWGRPLELPPHGQPRIRFSVTTLNPTAGICPAVIDRAMEIIGLGRGWVVACGPHMPEPKRLSSEAKGKMRRRNLERRITRKAPLFANDLIQIELSRDPQYYSGMEYRRSC